MTSDDLGGHRGAGYSLVQTTGLWMFAGIDGKKPRAAKPPRLVFWANSGEAMRDAVLAGLGLAILPSFFVADDITAGRIRALKLDCEPLAAELWVLHSRRREVRPVITALIAWLAEKLGDPPFWETQLLSGKT
jgi:DNA-binding transcriptional LysR family regulator